MPQSSTAHHRAAAFPRPPSAPWYIDIEPVVPRVHHDDRPLPSDRDFIEMRNAYRATGGVARGHELARRLESRDDGPDHVGDLRLARLIVARDVFSFEWRECVWVPMFQLDTNDLSVNQSARQVSAELASDFDGWSLGVWFAQPNAWLRQRRPVELLATELHNVLQAARADRYIAVG